MRHVLIADDYPLCIAALTLATRQVDSGIIIETAATLSAANAKLAERAYDLVLLDLGLPDGNSFEGLASFTKRYPATPIIVIGTGYGHGQIQRSAALGAKGFVSKAGTLEAMQAAVTAVLDGREGFPPGFEAVSVAGAPGRRVDPIGRLSHAQRRVMTELRAGHANKEIGFRLGLAESTVKAHVSAIFRVLGVNNRSQALIAVRDQTRRGIVFSPVDRA